MLNGHIDRKRNTIALPLNIMKEKYPIKKLECNRFFSVAFVYLPSGPLVYIGDEKLILTELESYPTSHANFVHYIERPAGNQKMRSRWVIVGRKSEQYCFKFIRNKKRRVIGLFVNNKKQYEWRKLPKKHLKQLKSISRYSFINK